MKKKDVVRNFVISVSGGVALAVLMRFPEIAYAEVMFNLLAVFVGFVFLFRVVAPIMTTLTHIPGKHNWYKNDQVGQNLMKQFQKYMLIEDWKV